MQSRTTGIQILTLGHPSAAELHEVEASLAAIRPDADVKHAKTVHEVAELVEEQAWFPDLTIVAQQWSDEFSSADVGQLLALLPLTRLVCCYGPWCDSDGRTRDLWPLAARVPADCAASRIALELAVIDDEQPMLPLTAARDEIFEFAATDTVLQSSVGLSPTVVTSPDPVYRRCLLDWLGAAATAVPHGPATALWDADPWDADVAQRLERFRAEHPSTKIVALAGFTHSQHAAAIEQCGADVVVSKLAPWAKLRRHLEGTTAPV